MPGPPDHAGGAEARTARWRTALIWVPLPAFIVATAVVYVAGPNGIAESAVILATVNTLFCGVTSLALAFLAANTYRTTGERGLLALACAALAFGVIYVLAGPLVAVSVDALLVLHNGGLLGAVALFILSAVWILHDGERKPRARGKAAYVWLSFAAVLLGLAALTTAALLRITPAFYSPETGITRVRTVVLGLVVVGFVVAALLVYLSFRRTRSGFLLWYALGLAMMAVGLGTVWLGQPGSVISWVGRAAQYAGGVYLLVAMISATAESGQWRIVFSRALRESEERYANLATMSPDAILVQAGDVCVFANPAAARLLGVASPEDLLGADVLDFFQPERRVAMDVWIREARQGGALALEESTVITPDGRLALVDVTGGRIEQEGEPAVQLVLRDVTARKEAEAILHERETEKVAHAERARIARDLHDSVTQALFAATLKAEVLSIAAEEDDPAVAAAADDLGRLSRGTLAQMRTMLLELRGDPVTDVPLPQLLRNIVEAVESRAAVRVELELNGDPKVPPAVHEAVYRITQEALNNVVRHAGARTAHVRLEVDAESAVLDVRDDGRGFDQACVGPGHYGLKTMRERADGSGGALDVRCAPGEGTLITAVWPLSAPASGVSAEPSLAG